MSWDNYIDMLEVTSTDPIEVAQDLIGRYGLRTESRAREFVYPRQYLMFWLCNKTTESKARIGDLFNRDHATVIHAQKAVDAAIEIEDPVFWSYANKIRNILNDLNLPDRVTYHGNSNKVRVEVMIDSDDYESILDKIRYKEITISRFIKKSIRKSLQG